MRKWLNRAVQPRREARQHDRRLAAARRADQRRQALPSDRVRKLGDRLVPAEEQRRLSRAEIGQAGIGTGSNRALCGS